MQFAREIHAGIASGAVTLSYRLWARPHARVGGRYRVGDVTIELDDMELVPFGSITASEVRRTGSKDLEALRTIAAHAGPIDDDTLVYRIEFHVAR